MLLLIELYAVRSPTSKLYTRNNVSSFTCYDFKHHKSVVANTQWSCSWWIPSVPCIVLKVFWSTTCQLPWSFVVLKNGFVFLTSMYVNNCKCICFCVSFIFSLGLSWQLCIHHSVYDMLYLSFYSKIQRMFSWLNGSRQHCFITGYLFFTVARDMKGINAAFVAFKM